MTTLAAISILTIVTVFVAVTAQDPIEPTFKALDGYRHCAFGYNPPPGPGPVATCDSPISCLCLQHRRCLANNRLPRPQYTNCACDREFVSAFRSLAAKAHLESFLRFWELACCNAAVNEYGICPIRSLAGASKLKDINNPFSLLSCRKLP
jgi:hypothetical protein